MSYFSFLIQVALVRILVLDVRTVMQVDEWTQRLDVRCDVHSLSYLWAVQRHGIVFSKAFAK